MTAYRASKDHWPKIFCLPDEILLEIFETLKIWRPANKAQHVKYASSSQDIANVRLVCRRFAATSSHLLVHYCRVDGISQRSLQKIEEISRHPLISKGVHIVRLEAVYFAPTLAASLENFALHAANRAIQKALRQKKSLDNKIEQAETQELDCLEHLMRKKADFGVLMEELKIVLKAWGSLVQRDSDKPTSSENIVSSVVHAANGEEGLLALRYVDSLRRAYQQYRRQYEEQEDLRRANQFSQCLASALARMPRARIFEMNDFGHCYSSEDTAAGTQDFDILDENNLAGILDLGSLGQPLTWDDGVKRQLGSPPSELLFSLPVEMARAGVQLGSFSVQTTNRAEHFYPLFRGLNQSLRISLGSAVNLIGLQSFSFVQADESKLPSRSNPTSEDVQLFSNYMAAMTSSESLERLRVEVDSGWVDGSLDPGPKFSLTGLASSEAASSSVYGWTPRSRLSEVRLSNVPLRLADLENFVAHADDLDGGLECLTLSGVRLVNGTWLCALEVLRRLRARSKELIEPLGAECDAFAARVDAWSETIFCSKPGQRSAAEQFINGEAVDHPLKGSRDDGSSRLAVDEHSNAIVALKI